MFCGVLGSKARTCHVLPKSNTNYIRKDFFCTKKWHVLNGGRKHARVWASMVCVSIEILWPCNPSEGFATLQSMLKRTQGVWMPFCNFPQNNFCLCTARLTGLIMIYLQIGFLACLSYLISSAHQFAFAWLFRWNIASYHNITEIIWEVAEVGVTYVHSFNRVAWFSRPQPWMLFYSIATDDTCPFRFWILTFALSTCLSMKLWNRVGQKVPERDPHASEYKISDSKEPSNPVFPARTHLRRLGLWVS